MDTKHTDTSFYNFLVVLREVWEKFLVFNWESSFTIIPKLLAASQIGKFLILFFEVFIFRKFWNADCFKLVHNRTTFFGIDGLEFVGS